MNRTDSVIKNHFDSIYVHDSIYTTKYLRSDTVFSETVKYKLIYKQCDMDKINSILNSNIICTDFFKWDYENWKPIEEIKEITLW